MKKPLFIPAFYLLTLLLCLLHPVTPQSEDPVTVVYASTIIGTSTSALAGSVNGGTQLYIHGLGFDTTADNNQVFVGLNPCIITAKGATEDTLTCTTTAPIPNTPLTSLPITVYVTGKTPYTCSTSGCLFSYLPSQTPLLKQLFPRSALGWNNIKYFGVHRISDLGDGRSMGDVTGLYIGSSLCSRLDIFEVPLQYPSNDNYITCQVAPVQEGGYYNVTERVTPGYATHGPRMSFGSAITGSNYEFITVPNVSSISAHSGSVAGQTITIAGSGFSTDLNKIKVRAANVPCTVSAATETSITCTVQPSPSGNNFGALPTNTAAPTATNKFVSGSGFKYTRYNIANLSSKTVSGLRTAISSNSNTITLLEDGFRGELESPNIYGSNYGQVFKGYFKAPVTGNYVFRGLADDALSVYLSSVKGSAELDYTTPLISSSSYSDSGSYSRQYYAVNTPSLTSAPTYLQAGEYRYMEAYHINGGGDGYLQISVEVPNTNSNLDGQVFEVQKFSINPTVQPEVFTYTVTGATSGTTTFSQKKIDSNGDPYFIDASIDYNASANDFLGMLNTFDLYSSYSPSVTLDTFDSAGGNTSTTNLPVYKRVYTVSIPKFRASTVTAQSLIVGLTNLVASSGTPTVTYAKVQDHSPPVGGTYTLVINNTQIGYWANKTTFVSQIPYNTSTSTLQSYIASSLNAPYVEVRALSTSYVDGASFIVSFVGVKGNLDPISPGNVFLTGGTSTPSIDVSTFRDGSTNLLVQPVTVEYVATAAASSQVIVNVGGIDSYCAGDCSYVISTSSPTLTVATLSGTTLTMNLTAGSTTFTISSLTVTFDGQPCTTLSGTIARFTCTLPANPDGSPQVRAGSYLPLVNIQGIGYAAPAVGLADITVDLKLNASNPTSSAMSGGVSIWVSGNGFPLTLDEPFAATICGQAVKVLVINNTHFQTNTPPCSDLTSNITITYKNTPKNISFSFTNTTTGPVITSMSSHSASPVLKGTLDIVGSGFGTNLAAVTAYLVNSTGRIYQLNMLSGNNTNLKVNIPGGQSGVFKVVVNVAGVGDSVANPVNASNFVYEIVITDISPKTGSANGGTLLTITGRNFCPILNNNQVYIGDAVNNWCLIQSANSTTITCITPPLKDTYTVLNQSVTVVGRVIIDSTCGGNCTFTYDNSSSMPRVNIPSSVNFNYGDVVSLTGSGFVNNNRAPKVFVNGIQTTVSNQTNNTFVSFTFPSLQNGTYALNIYVDGYGYAYPTLQVNTLVNFTTLNLLTGSVVGNKYVLMGNGLLPLNDTRVTLKITTSSSTTVTNYEVLSYAPDAITLRFFGGWNNLVYKFNYTVGSYTATNNHTCASGATPSVSLTSNASVAYASNLTITLNRVNYPSVVPTEIFAIPNMNGQPMVPANQYIPLTITSNTTGSMTLDASVLTAGNYTFSVYFKQYGYAQIGNTLEVQASTYNTSVVQSGYTGGAAFTVAGTGLSAFSRLTVAGTDARLISATPSLLTYALPPLVTKLSQSTFGLVKESVLKGTPIADIPANAPLAFDSSRKTFYSSTDATCFVGWDFGSTLTADIIKIKYYPYYLWKSAGQYLIGGAFTGSNDNATWTPLFTVDSTVHTGYNIWRPSTPLTTSYRYVRFEHNSTSGCKLSDFQIIGRLVAPEVSSLVSNFYDVTFTDGMHPVTWANKVEYRADRTPTVSSISPLYGSPVGGYNITINGTGFSTNISSIKVFADDIPCTVQTANSTQIVCLVGARPNMPTSNSFNITVGDSLAAINTQPFMYAYRWTDPATWGGDIPPIDGDAIYVPEGMVLLVDTSTPNLKSIIVEGTIIFSDETDMYIETGSLIVNQGRFIAGTEQNPYKNLLVFMLHGGYYDKQLPSFGNKVIGCHCCQFDMHGKVRNVTWTELSATVTPGQNYITVMKPVDWQVGEEIVIAGTGFDHYESEQVTITAIDASRTNITVFPAFTYQHISAEETFGTDKIAMRAEVGLLTRNIKVTGDPDSILTNYGAHLMMHGTAEEGLVGHIAYTEFTLCGQPKIVGRYCMHFHMNGDVSDSYVRGNSVHESFARVLTLHAVQFLTVEDNVGYRVRGHNFFLEDGIETYNLIQNNLAISSIQVWTMMQTDISVASFWITNPLNTVRGNHAAGGDFYGMWYEVKEHPDGASATNDICPQSMPLGESHDNVAHSNVRFGLRIFKIYSSQNPCWHIRVDTDIDPWASNPSIQSKFYNYVLWRNKEAGLLAEQVGNMIFDNFTIADSGLAGMQFHMTNFTKELVVAQNSAIIGQTITNGPSNAELSKTYGLISPRTDGFKASDIRFYNFPNTTTVFQSCSECENMDLRATSGKSSFFEKIKYTNVSGNYIFWNGPRRNVFYDLDGTLTSNQFDGVTRASATLSPYYYHNDISGKCFNSTNTKWDTSLVCGPGTIVRPIMLANPAPFSWFSNTRMKAIRLNSPTDDISNLPNTTRYGDAWMLMAMKDQKSVWSMPFVLGYTYDIWWNDGIDFTHMAIAPSMYFNQSDNVGTILRFNYTENRELFEITNLVSGKLETPFISPQSTILDPATCSIGDYYHDPTGRYLYVCVTGKNKKLNTYIDLNGIKCRYLCPKPIGEFVKESFIRLWNNASQWPGGVVPRAGDNVTINGNWTVLLNEDPAVLNNLTINGDLIIDERNTKIEANFIWIRAGSITAGSNAIPFKYNLTIQLNGNKADRGYVIDPMIAGNKMLVNTGNLSLYGQAPGTVTARLTSPARKTNTSITVTACNGWAVGNTIGIAPSFSNQNQYEKVTITAISGNTITFTPALAYDHYGASGITINNTYGTMDMRAAVVLLDRNIKIVAGPDSNYGFRLVTYSFKDGSFKRIGNTILKGVEVIGGGQADTDYAALYFQDIPVNEFGGSEVSGSAIHDCQGYCMKLSNFGNITVNNNAFFVGHKFIVYAETMFDYEFTNNVLIGALDRATMTGAPSGDDVSCYNQYKSLDWDTDNNIVQNNLCQGSAGEGFVFPHTPCEYLGVNGTSGFIDNTAGSCVIGFQLNRGPYRCQAGERLKAYGSKIGFLAHPPGTNMIMYQNLMMADNGRGMGLRSGGPVADNNTAILKNSWIGAVTRPNCSYCYGSSATDCTNTYALRLYVSTINGEEFPDKFGPHFDTICRNENFDAKAYLYNVTFENYRVNYTGLSQCSSNVVFIPHPLAHDLTGSHHLWQSPCVNCQPQAYGFFTAPDDSELGWFGGCGLLYCTGRNNYLIHDHDGSFLGSAGIIVANNTNITQGMPCTYYTEINGAICNSEDFAVLEYESIAPDFNTRIMWPVQNKYDGGLWNSYTNGYREWDWNGKEPNNKRMGRFITALKLYEFYNMTFEAQPPSDMRFQIQRRTPNGDNTDWVAVRIYYPVPNSVSVAVGGKVIDSILATSAEPILNRTATCGANKFFYDNNTIQFIVTGNASCQVRVKLTSSVQVTARLAVNIDEFYNKGGITTFLDRMCAFLNISTDRLKIVGVRSGSTIVDFVVTPSITEQLSNGTSTTPNSANEYQEMTKVAAALSNPSAIDLGGLGSVISTSATVTVITVDGKIYDPNSDKPQSNNNAAGVNVTTIVVATVVSVLSASLVGVTSFFLVKKIRTRQIIEPEDSADLRSIGDMNEMNDMHEKEAHEISQEHPIHVNMKQSLA